MKNIWLINNHSYPPGTSNWRRHYDLCKELVKDGYGIDIICGSFVHDRKNQILNKNEKFRVENYSGINYHILNGLSYNGNIKRIISMIEFMIKVFFYEKKIENKPDIIYCSCPHPFNGLISLYLAKKYKVPFLLEIRDLWPDTWVEMGAMTKNNLIYKIFEYIEKLLYKKADKIIGLMPGIEVFKEKGVKEDKAIWISNGIDLTKFDENSQKESKYQFDKNKFNFLYTGSIGTANALEIIFEVAKKIKNDDNIVFNFVGEGPLKNKYLKYVEQNNLSNVKFYNSVEKDEVPALLKEADCLILPTKETGLYKYGISPNKLFEYLAASKIILLSCKTEYDYIQKNGCGLTILPENLEEYLKAMDKIINLSEADRLEIEKNSRKLAEEFFSMKVLSKKLDRVIEETLSKRSK